MYFWNINKLKAQLIERPLTEKELLPYLIATLLMFTLIPYLPDTLHFNAWDYLEMAIACLAVIIGTLWLYAKNLGSNIDNKGSHFLQRYIALGWVVLVRFIVFVIPVIILMAFLASNFALFNTESDATGWIDVMLITMIEVLLYWYFGKHIADVAHNAKY